MKRIGILTSGGDAPGMNAAIRAVVRTCVYNDIEVYGISRGYGGLLEQDIYPMNSKSVANIIDRGGTILQTSRSDFFPTAAGQKKAVEILKDYGIEVLVVIGGDGSLNGAMCLKRLGIEIVGIPGTIDNDFGASDYTIGFDTAVTTAIDAISKIRDTTYSHNRINVVQVMGRHCGDIAMYAGLACGAKGMIIPEKETDLEELCQRLIEGRDRGKMHSIIMLAEGCGGYRDYCDKIQDLTGVETKGTNLGYIQRGGSPSNFDRQMASNMGYQAVQAILAGNTGTVIVYRDGKYLTVDLGEALDTPKVFDEEMYQMIQVLSI